MAFAYTQYDLHPSGMLSEHPFPLVGRGRKVSFRFPEGTQLRKDIYLCFDQKLMPAPFANGSPMDTPVLVPESFIASAHTASAIVVDLSLFRSSNTLACESIASAFPGGYWGKADTSVSYSGTYFCSDSYKLASSYVNGYLSNPDAEIQHCIERHLLTAANDSIRREVNSDLLQPDPLKFLNILAPLNAEISRETVYRVHRELPWLTVKTCSVHLQVTNADELASLSDKMQASREQRRQAIFQVLADSFGNNALTPEIVQITTAFLQNNPEANAQQMLSFCTELKSLNRYFTMEQLLQMAHEVGALSSLPGGASHALLP